MCVCMSVCVQSHLTSCRICTQVSVVAIELFHHGALQACPLSLPVLHQLLPVTGFPFVSALNLFAQNKGQANKTATFCYLSLRRASFSSSIFFDSDNSFNSPAK